MYCYRVQRNSSDDESGDGDEEYGLRYLTYQFSQFNVSDEDDGNIGFGGHLSDQSDYE